MSGSIRTIRRIIIILLAAVCWTAVSAADRATETDERGFVLDASGYFASYGKTAVGYVGTEETLVIPEDIDAVVFQSSYPNEHVRVISLENFGQKTEFSIYSDFPALEQFIGPSDPKSIYVVEDGVLFHKEYFDGYGRLSSSVVRYPAAKKGPYSVPDWIEYVSGFKNATGLTAIYFPDSVKSIGSGAFSGCTGLESVTIPSQVSGISDEAFMNCTSLKTVTIEEGVRYISDSAFAGCTALKTLRIPASVTEIGKNAVPYAGCTLDVSRGSAGHKYAIKNDLPFTIDGETPSAEDKLEEDGFTCFVRADGNATIIGCSREGDIIIPATIKGVTVDNLEEKLFYGKSGITSVTIPATVTYFGSDRDDNLWDYVFAYCYDLKAIYVDENNPVFCSVDGVLFLKDLSWLVNYPCARRAVSYHVRKGTSLCCTSFASVKCLKALYLDDMKTTWMGYTFYGDDDLTVYYIPGGAAESKAKSDSFAKFAEYDASVPEPVIQKIVSINKPYFPDDIFRQYIAEQFDEDHDLWLDDLEIAAAEKISVYGMNIATLEGVNYLTALKELYCGSNRLTSLDLSGCTALRLLYCDSNMLTSLDLSGFTDLSELSCSSNQLVSLNVTGCSALWELICSSNQLTSLDLTGCNKLVYLSCGYNQLTCLDLNGTEGGVLLSANGNERVIRSVNGCVDLSAIPGFNPSLASQWQGGVLNGSILTVQKGGEVTYQYDCGHGTASFTLIVTEYTMTEDGRILICAPTEDERGYYRQGRMEYGIPALRYLDVLRLPESLNSISEEAFAGISAEAIIIPDGCTEIGSKAFMNCRNLIYVRIPAGVTVPDDAFTGCPEVIIDQKPDAQGR